MVVRGTQVAKAFGHGFQDSFNFDHCFERITVNRARFLFFTVFVAGSFPIFGPVPWTLVLKAWPIRALIPGLPVISGLPVVPGLPVISGLPVVPGLPVISGLPVVPGFSVVPGLSVLPMLPFFPKGTRITRVGIGTLGAIVTKIRGIVIRFG
jgi:hypothetical protein